MAVDLRRVVQNAGRLIQEKGEEGVPVRGVRFCKAYDIARRGRSVNVFGRNADNLLRILSHAG